MRRVQQAKARRRGVIEWSIWLETFAAVLLAFICAARAGHAFTNASLSGTYACKLDGSFLLQPFSVNTLTFTADGKGSIEGLGNVSTALAVKSGNMSALMSKFGTSQVPSSACLLF